MSRDRHDVTETVRRDPETGFYRVTFDSSNVDPSAAVVGAIEAVDETDPADLPPLYGSIDTDALDKVLDSSATDGPDCTRTVTFSYQNYTITVESNGLIELRPKDRGDDPSSTLG